MNLTILLSLIVATAVVYGLSRALFNWIQLRGLKHETARELLSTIGQKALARLPDEIALVREDAPQWHDPAGVEQQVAPLLREGFIGLGAYRVDKMPGVLVHMLFQPETYVEAHIYDHPKSGSWTEFVTRYTDGSSHTLSTLPPTGMNRPAWIRKIQADKSVPTDQLYRQFKTQREWHGIKPITAQDVIPEFEDGFRRLMAWRYQQGISPQEVAHVARKWVIKEKAKSAAQI